MKKYTYFFTVRKLFWINYIYLMNSKLKTFPEKLYTCWHPVGYSHEIKSDEPFGSILLDEAIVVWRTSDGKPHAMRDLCIHRGTALSLSLIHI